MAVEKYIVKNKFSLWIAFLKHAFSYLAHFNRFKRLLHQWEISTSRALEKSFAQLLFVLYCIKLLLMLMVFIK